MPVYTLGRPSGMVYADGIALPLDDSKPEVIAYVDWLKQGNGPTPFEEPVDPYPRIEVTAWQLGQALAAFGWLNDVNAAAESHPNPMVKFGWTRAPTFFSDQPLTLGLAMMINKTRAQLQSLFELASTLKQ